MLHFIDNGLYINVGTLGDDGKIAAFDMGGTIIKKINNNWYMLPNRIQTLKKYQDNGYTLVIFSNSHYESLEHINNTIIMLMMYGITPWVFVSTETNIYRKPNLGMWYVFLYLYNLFKGKDTLIDYNISFFTGNKLGRYIYEESRYIYEENTDKLFADEIGLIVYTPECIFNII